MDIEYIILNRIDQITWDNIRCSVVKSVIDNVGYNIRDIVINAINDVDNIRDIYYKCIPQTRL